MEFNKTVRARRSVRAYEAGKTVEKAQIEAMLEAALEAPSWKNSETGRYYVAMSPELVEEIRSSCLPQFNQKSSAGAPVMIVTAFVKGISGFTKEGEAENELGDGWGCYDLGLQNANLTLKAAELGLDTLIMGIRDADRLRSLLSIPEEQEIAAVIAVGHGAVRPEMPKRRTLEETAVFF